MSNKTRIAVTQRVTVAASHGERRDCLDQAWSLLLDAAGLAPLLLPNVPEVAASLVADTRPAGILLTGGNDLLSCGGDAPERDAVERWLLGWALENAVPVLGVCRGMQIVQEYFGVRLQPVENHVAVRHRLRVEAACRHSAYAASLEDVNSFHNFGTYDSVPELRVVARAEDGVVMAVEHPQHDVQACMWHPERERPLRRADIDHLKQVFGARK